MDSTSNSTLSYATVQDHHDLVSWQSAFWALVPIQLSVMTQPSRRVLNFPIRLRTYIRSSPIICAFDCLSRLIEFSIILWYCILGSPHRAYEYLDDWFEEEPAKLGMQGVEDLRFIRALLFILGTLPQAVKLMCFGGILWTKAWAALFLISYITTETLPILRKRLLNPIQLHTLPVQGISRPNSRIHVLSRIRFTFAGIAVCLQTALLIWACAEIVRPLRVQEQIRGDHALSLFLFPLWIFTAFLVFCLILALVWWVFLTFCGASLHGSPVTAMIAAFIGLSLASAAIFWPVFTIPEIVWRLFGFYSLCTFVAACIMATVIFMRSEVFRREVLLHSQAIRLGGQDPDDWSMCNSIAAWSMFVVITIISILWYALRYSSEGTYKPSWTNRLG
ncbi:hypothetical protein DM02DRAFT_619170 [Periconia macrospinosa]|uniref:Uncharacterized protein n=1 Tax=Periconia macrospinosa TaxID=97972 RepID=A0A2V1D8V4_9PLEO|nr:hypothetical protein DM02DRAFT_619170 [Periconia macrospinosa]